jgi:uncharacterized protein
MVNHYFLDTSALAKRYIPEIGTSWINRITSPTENNILLLSQLTWVELQSAISRRQRENILTPEQSQILSTNVQTHWHNSATNPFTFVSADDRLLTIAQLEGLTTCNPNRT